MISLQTLGDITKLSQLCDITLIIYNYRLLMRSTRYHVDRVWYWLTDAVGGGLPIPDKVYMVPRRPKSKVYNCFIKLSGILHKIYFNHKETSMALSAASKNRRETRCVYCDVIRKCTPNSPVWAKNWRVNLRFRCDITETPNRPSLSICGQFTLRYTRVNAVSANQRRAKEGEFPDHLIIKWYHLVQLVISLSSKVISHNNQGDITSKARWYHILLINSKTAPHKDLT